MAVISGFNPTPDVEEAFAHLMRVKAKRGSSDSIAEKHPLLNKPPARPDPWPSPLDMRWAARWLAERRYSDNRRDRQTAMQESQLALLTARELPTYYWREVMPFRDQLEVYYPSHVRDLAQAINPYDPAEIKPTWCTYSDLGSVSDYDASPAGARPGWSAEVDPDNWFRDTVFRQRALYFDLSGHSTFGERDPILVHLTGSIEALTERTGARTWFAPAVGCIFGPALEALHPAAKPMPFANRAFVQRDLVLPPAGWGWWHELSFDWLINITAARRKARRRLTPTMRLNLGGMPTFGRYHARNSWAEATARLNARVFVPHW